MGKNTNGWMLKVVDEAAGSTVWQEPLILPRMIPLVPWLAFRRQVSAPSSSRVATICTNYGCSEVIKEIGTHIREVSAT